MHRVRAGRSRPAPWRRPRACGSGAPGAGSGGGQCRLTDRCLRTGGAARPDCTSLERMAQKKHNRSKTPGRLSQMREVFLMTIRQDRRSLWYILAALLLPIALGVALGLTVGQGSWIGVVLWIVFGLLGGLLAALIVLGRRAERAAFAQIEGQPGAVGAVIRSSLRGSWQGSEMPVAVNPRSQEAVYRVIGHGGVVLIGEGAAGKRLERLLADEERKVRRVAPNVAIHRLHVGEGDDAIPLRRVTAGLRRLPKALNRSEITAVAHRLESLNRGLGMPKGIDPMHARPDRRALRGR